MDNISVVDPWLVEGVRKARKRVLHPILVVSLSEIISGMCTSGFLPIFSSEHGHLGLNHEVLEFHGLNQIGVPDVSTVANAQIRHDC